jgi:hypothetical protein
LLVTPSPNFEPDLQTPIDDVGSSFPLDPRAFSMIVPGRGWVPAEVERRTGPVGSPETAEVLEDRVAAEEPMEIRIETPGADGRVETHQVAVTMRTPGMTSNWRRGSSFRRG